MTEKIIRKKKVKMNQMERRKYLFLSGLFILPFLNFLVFWLYLNISAVDFAFKVELADGTVIYSLKNFETMFKAMTMPRSTFWIALRNTMLYWVTNSIFVYAVALLIGYFIYKKVPGHSFYKIAFYFPNLIAPTILVLLFKQIIAANGPVGTFYPSFEAVPKFLASEKYAIWTCLFYSMFFGFGSNLLVISGMMSQIETSVIEAAKLDGCNMAQEMFFVVIPAIWPSIIANMISSIAGMFNSSGPILLLTNGAYNTRTINFWIYEQVYSGQNYYYPAAIGLFFALIAMPLTFFSRWLMRIVVPSNDSIEEV